MKVIASLVHCSELTDIVFSRPYQQTNAGFQALIDNGGGLKLKSITAGRLVTQPSDSLTSKYLSELMPHCKSLINMKVGPKKPPSAKLLKDMEDQIKQKETDLLPGNAIPVERMTFDQIKEQLKRRSLDIKGIITIIIINITINLIILIIIFTI